MNKLLIIGAGGIGSHFTELLSQMPLPKMEVVIADSDIVEPTQTKPVQNFLMDEVGKNKAEAIAKRFGYKSLAKRIKTSEQLNPYDFIVCCADNDEVRELVITHCCAHNYSGSKSYIILRATGRNASAFPKLITLTESLKYVDSLDKNGYSCQTGGVFNVGHLISASIGIQMLLNYTRGIGNAPINIRI